MDVDSGVDENSCAAVLANADVDLLVCVCAYVCVCAGLCVCVRAREIMSARLCARALACACASVSAPGPVFALCGQHVMGQ